MEIRQTSAMINNEWVGGTEKMVTLNPATESAIGDVTNCREKEVDMAVEAATDAFYHGEWSQTGGYERGKMLNRLADLIEANAEELALLECLDNGKTVGEATGADLPLTIQCYRYYAGWADKIHGSVVSPSGPVTGNNIFGYVEKEPVGVVGQIIPWNFPLLMQAWKLGPALATGCTSVLKVAPQTPLSALRVGELIQEAGFPAGAVNIIPGDDETGKIVANHPGFDKIAFTGSTSVGKKIMGIAAESDNMKRVTLELGGKSPLIVFADADMEAALAGAHVGLFLNQGQCCCAGSRIFVEDSAYDEFVEKASAAARERTVGPGWMDGNAQGPQVSQEQFDNVMGYINTGKAEGATLMAGGSRAHDQGYFIEPTVFADVSDDMTIAREEIFGPVMSIMKFSDIDEVVQRANNTDYGLAAAIYSSDFPKARQVAKKVRRDFAFALRLPCGSDLGDWVTEQLSD
eukprot:COSAG04_NODE_468_length_13857_cov_28.468382_9_plen_461_part_00